MKRDAWLWLANALGPVTWFVLLTGGFYLVPSAHETAHTSAVIAVHVVALVLVLVSYVVAIRELKLTVGDAGDVLLQRRRFLAITALGFATISLLIIAGMLLAVGILGTGAEP